MKFSALHHTIDQKIGGYFISSHNEPPSQSAYFLLPVKVELDNGIIGRASYPALPAVK